MKQKNGIVVLLIVGVVGVGAICACLLVFGLIYLYLPQSVQTTALPATQAPIQSVPTLSAPTPVTPAPAPISAACSQVLNQDLQSSETDAATGKNGTEQTLVSYVVSGDNISDPQYDDVPASLQGLQQDTAGQQKVWDLFTQLIPLDQRREVTDFTVFTDGRNGTLGAVVQMDNPHNWSLEMDLADAGNFADLSTTLVHEFAHLLSLNDSQVTTDWPVFNNPDDQQIYDQEAAKCPNYFTFEGCSRSDSYLNQFVQRYWTALLPDWKSFQGETDPDVLDQDTYDFYKRYSDQFDSEYAATSPEEDLAESFLFFVYAPRPDGTSIADQKILFFYEFPELVTLRAQILAPLCTHVEQP